MDETKLQRIRKTLQSIGLPAWASWVDRALEQEDRRMQVLERRASLRVLPRPSPDTKEKGSP